MSTVKLYQMYDSVSMQTAGPILADTRAESATRMFTDVLKRPETLPGQYPEDFALMHIGEQNTETGEITPCDPEIIYTGRVWKQLQQEKRDTSDVLPFEDPGNPARKQR